mgnify:CR=1 FL=1
MLLIGTTNLDAQRPVIWNLGALAASGQPGAAELIREILDHIEADPEKLVSLDRRSYLSQESFKPPPTPAPNQAQDVASFRLTCRRFSELGAIHQFARVTTRFSRHGLQRLENIAGQAHLAKHVKKFSYMVPYFYVEGPLHLPHYIGANN